MKTKYVFGSLAAAALLTACSDELVNESVFAPENNANEVVGHDLVSKGIVVAPNDGTVGTRVNAQGWQNDETKIDKLGLAWYNVNPDGIQEVQKKADYKNLKESLEGSNALYANNVLTMQQDKSGFYTRANIYQGAYFTYFPWQYMNTIGDLKFTPNKPAQDEDFDTERMNEVPFISATEFLGDTKADREEYSTGEFTKQFTLNPVANVLKLVLKPSDAVKNALGEDYIYSEVSAAAIKNDDLCINNQKVFVPTITINPNMLPDAGTSTNTDAAIKNMLGGETWGEVTYGTHAGQTTTVDPSIATLAEESTVRMFLLPTDGGQYYDNAGDITVPNTKFTVPVTTKDGVEVGYFVIRKSDDLQENKDAVKKLGMLLTPVVEFDGQFIGGWNPKSTGSEKEDNEGKWFAYDADDNLLEDVEPVESKEDTYLEGEIAYWQQKNTYKPEVAPEAGYTLTQIVRGATGKPAAIKFELSLTADNFVPTIFDYISNQQEWDAAVDFFDALYGDDEEKVAEFMIDASFPYVSNTGIRMPKNGQPVVVSKDEAFSDKEITLIGKQEFPENLTSAEATDGQGNTQPDQVRIAVAPGAIVTVTNNTKTFYFSVNSKNFGGSPSFEDLYTEDEINAAQAIVEAEDYEAGSDPEAEELATKKPGEVKTVYAGGISAVGKLVMGSAEAAAQVEGNEGFVVIPQASVGCEIVSYSQSRGGDVILVITEEAESGLYAEAQKTVKGLNVTGLSISNVEYELSEEDEALLGKVNPVLFLKNDAKLKGNFVTADIIFVEEGKNDIEADAVLSHAVFMSSATELTATITASAALGYVSTWLDIPASVEPKVTVTGKGALTDSYKSDYVTCTVTGGVNGYFK